MRRLLLLVIIVASIYSCNDQLSDDVEVLVNIEDEFELDLGQELSTKGSISTIKLSTLELKDCKNYTIGYELVKGDNLFTIYLEELSKPSLCEDGFGPAIANIPLGILSDGIYAVDIFLQNTIQNKATLTVSEDAFHIEMQETHGIQLTHSTLIRIPASTIWGFASYDSINQQPTVNNFFEDLSSMVRSREWPDGYYGFFEIQGGKLNLETNTLKEFSTPFLFDLQGQLTELEALLEQYRNQSPDSSIEFHVFTWLGTSL